jgi:hypothetical protein
MPARLRVAEQERADEHRSLCGHEPRRQSHASDFMKSPEGGNPENYPLKFPRDPDETTGAVREGLPGRVDGLPLTITVG